MEARGERAPELRRAGAERRQVRREDRRMLVADRDQAVGELGGDLEGKRAVGGDVDRNARLEGDEAEVQMQEADRPRDAVQGVVQTERMLEEVDLIVCDLQDVGCRIYTFVYTIANCMRAARRLGKRVVVCDRPNPIGGVGVEGNILETEFESLVGQFPLPTRHGMTAGELSKMFNEHWGIGCDLEVVTMEGWSRELWFDETDAPWVLPSPNMPTLDSASVFPGTVHLEGTQMSEGRGTTRPFEIVGAPYVEAGELARQLEGFGLPGVKFRATNFLPTFQKHAGVPCGGVQVHVLEREAYRPVLSGVAIVKSCFDLYGESFRWKEPPYEYVYDKNPFDVIAGSERLRCAIEKGDSLDAIRESWREGLEAFEKTRAEYLLY